MQQCADTGLLNLPGQSRQIEFSAYDLEDLSPIGSGSYGGIVQKMRHKATEAIMAVKVKSNKLLMLLKLNFL